MFALLVLSACGDDPVAQDTGTLPPSFCATLDEADLVETVEGGATGASGRVYVRLITDETDDPRDPLYVAFKDYALENVQTGGVATTGKTSGDGIVEEVLGAGTWSFRAAYPRGSRVCTAQIEFDVVAGQTSRACTVLSCP